MKPFIFEADHQGNNKITPIATMTNGMIYLAFHFVMGNVNFLTTNSNYPNREQRYCGTTTDTH